MNEESSVIAEDITEGEERRVIIANPRRYPALLPVVYAVGHQVGIPMQEINMLYRMRNPRQFLQDFTPTRQNAGSFAVGVGISETITFAANAAGIPILPAHLAFNFLVNYSDDVVSSSRQAMARLNHNISLLRNSLSQQTLLLTARPANEEETPLIEIDEEKRDRKICDCSFSSVIKRFQSLLMWKQSPEIPAEENNNKEHSTHTRPGKTKTE